MKKFVSWPKFSSLTSEHHKTKQIESAHMNRVVELNNKKVSWWHLLTWSVAGLYFKGMHLRISRYQKDLKLIIFIFLQGFNFDPSDITLETSFLAGSEKISWVLQFFSHSL